MYSKVRPALSYSFISMVKEGKMPEIINSAWQKIMKEITNG